MTALHRLEEAAGGAVREVARECVAIVVHWTRADDTVRCVRSIRADAPGLRVVVVDNASEDGSGAQVGRALTDLVAVEVVRAPRNGGFGAGCNHGIAHVLAASGACPDVLLVNPDATVEGGSIAAMRSVFARRPHVGIVGGLVLDREGTKVLYEAGRLRPWTLAKSHHAVRHGADEYEVGFVTGALMLIDGDLIASGLRFDERYFMYVEDLDLCREVRARGRRLWVTRHARVRHDEGGSQRGDDPVLGTMRAAQLEHIARGKALFARKWLTGPQRVVFFAHAFVTKPLVGLVVARHLRFLRPYLRGLCAGLRIELVSRGTRT